MQELEQRAECVIKRTRICSRRSAPGVVHCICWRLDVCLRTR
jgi:hypothetical protein